jgi:hypothetical protein
MKTLYAINIPFLIGRDVVEPVTDEIITFENIDTTIHWNKQTSLFWNEQYFISIQISMIILNMCE